MAAKRLTAQQKILQHLKDEYLNLAWLQKKTDIPYGTLYSIFVENRIPLTQERLNLINAACNKDWKLDPEKKSTTA